MSTPTIFELSKRFEDLHRMLQSLSLDYGIQLVTLKKNLVDCGEKVKNIDIIRQELIKDRETSASLQNRVSLIDRQNKCAITAHGRQIGLISQDITSIKSKLSQSYYKQNVDLQLQVDKIERQLQEILKTQERQEESIRRAAQASAQNVEALSHESSLENSSMVIPLLLINEMSERRCKSLEEALAAQAQDYNGKFLYLTQIIEKMQKKTDGLQSKENENQQKKNRSWRWRCEIL